MKTNNNKMIEETLDSLNVLYDIIYIVYFMYQFDTLRLMLLLNFRCFTDLFNNSYSGYLRGPLYVIWRVRY
ncbi:hypothetical protein C0J52_22223 [Blattella germanica]|nr:hypothetical protein C0J52_22223 [Blattella germanica]